tara:strand:+ start:266 stop:814 length:549 start_codon:yes stop_codon:yes gene_type:complete
MPLVSLLPIFDRLNREYFEGLLSNGTQPVVSLRWSDGRLKSTAGFYRHFHGLCCTKKPEIVLSKPLLTRLPHSALESTLCHEMIHAWIDLVLKVKEVHGVNFHRKMEVINSSQEHFQISVRHKFPVPAKTPKWFGVCPLCHSRFPYQRLVRGVACKRCCDLYYSGNWDISCLLSFEPFLKEA